METRVLPQGVSENWKAILKQIAPPQKRCACCRTPVTDTEAYIYLGRCESCWVEGSSYPSSVAREKGLVPNA